MRFLNMFVFIGAFISSMIYPGYLTASHSFSLRSAHPGGGRGKEDVQAPVPKRERDAGQSAGIGRNTLDPPITLSATSGTKGSPG
ncbi:uncharacterized protein FOMMEDRAFT_162374 [Fomitiporia mediterranea MF3/22]|uniref:uncharacterized protein n=1 Tax=Fomitiporia mediterranea (strain MF3/22) TaxID=694068 RepID=UPI00044073F2|nr:uncharacterized protein FOMMEDRAFT_162374 [Fomitiporia mediterranea MF3/22]EJC98030.1 hypothetical protein FOMMEDRAFT_162374 [Fomitiporia mediterranea MF3/22]